MKTQEGVHAVQGSMKSKGKKEYKSTSRRECGYCGRSHAKGQCPAYGKECMECGKRNHFASVCRGRKRNTRRSAVHMLEQPSSENDDDYLMTLTLSETEEEAVNTLRNDKYPDRVFAQMEIGGKTVSFQLDLGATCNVIRKQDVPSDATLQKTNQVLSVYNKDRIHPLGKCMVNLMNPKTKKTYKEQFVVVEDTFASLLGAATIQQMGLVNVRHEQITVTEARYSTMHPPNGKGSESVGSSAAKPAEARISGKALVDSYSDVYMFDGALGRIEGKLRLDIDAAVPPVQLPVRKVPIAIKPRL